MEKGKARPAGMNKNPSMQKSGNRAGVNLLRTKERPIEETRTHLRSSTDWTNHRHLHTQLKECLKGC